MEQLQSKSTQFTKKTSDLNTSDFDLNRGKKKKKKSCTLTQKHSPQQFSPILFVLNLCPTGYNDMLVLGKITQDQNYSGVSQPNPIFNPLLL